MDRRLRILVERGQRTGVFRHACTVVNTSICSQYDGLHTAMSPRPPPSHSRPLQAPVSGNAHSLRLFVGANESVLDEADRIASFGRLTEIGFEPTTSCIHAVFREANACLAAKAHYSLITQPAAARIQSYPTRVFYDPFFERLDNTPPSPAAQDYNAFAARSHAPFDATMISSTRCLYQQEAHAPDLPHDFAMDCERKGPKSLWIGGSDFSFLFDDDDEEVAEYKNVSHHLTASHYISGGNTIPSSTAFISPCSDHFRKNSLYRLSDSRQGSFSEPLSASPSHSLACLSDSFSRKDSDSSFHTVSDECTWAYLSSDNRRASSSASDFFTTPECWYPQRESSATTRSDSERAIDLAERMMDLNWGSTTSISGVVEEHPAEQEIEKELTVSLGRSALFALHCEALTTANPIVKEESPISEEAAFSISDLAALHGTTVSGDAYSASPDSKLTLDADPFSNSFTQSLGMRSLSATVVGSSRQNESGAVPGPWNGRCGQFSGKDKRTTVMRKSDPNRYLVSSLVENALNLHDIVVGKDKRTAVMLKNVPNRYTQEMLMDFINETHKGTYDFFYLRMDFVNNCNVGYAFINFIDPLSIVSFSARVTGQRWPKFNSAKLPVLVPAKIKTKAQFIEQFRNSPVMLEPQAYRPRLFHSSGPSAGLPMTFPGPTAEGVRARSGVLFSRVI